MREADELTGPLGYIPGVAWVPREHAMKLRERLDPLTPVILISRGGERASQLAHALEGAGMRMVAAMRGGMIAWRSLGFASTRDRSLLERRDELPAAALVTDREAGPHRLRSPAPDAAEPRAVRGPQRLGARHAAHLLLHPLGGRDRARGGRAAGRSPRRRGGQRARRGPAARVLVDPAAVALVRGGADVRQSSPGQRLPAPPARGLPRRAGRPVGRRCGGRGRAARPDAHAGRPPARRHPGPPGQGPAHLRPDLRPRRPRPGRGRR
ncbi:MAG: rhodanese-like domain-containing protein, partial [Nannocystaceae bacterium]